MAYLLRISLTIMECKTSASAVASTMNQLSPEFVRILYRLFISHDSNIYNISEKYILYIYNIYMNCL